MTCLHTTSTYEMKHHILPCINMNDTYIPAVRLLLTSYLLRGIGYQGKVREQALNHDIFCQKCSEFFRFCIYDAHSAAAADDDDADAST